jgi:hypothetical protein
MKKLLTILFIGFSTIHAQELTADTPAVAVGLWAQILAALGEALTVAIKAAVTALALKAIPLLNAYLKQIMHFRGAGVVADALTEALAEMSAELQKALADGVITPAEKAALKLKAREIAKARLQNLSGFYKRDLAGWIDEQLNVAISKTLARFMA